MADVDKKIISIQKSTRTALPIFISLHEKLRLSFGWYYNWHLWRGAIAVHLIILIVSVLGSISFAYLSYQTAKPKVVKASPGTCYWVGDTNPANWNDSTHWSSSSGGAGDTCEGGANVPQVGTDVVFDNQGTNSCNIDVAVSVASITNTSGYAGILDGAGNTVATSGNFQFDGGTLDLDTGTWTISGIWDTSGVGTLTKGSSTLIMNGTTQTIDAGGNEFNNVIISGTISLANTDFSVGATLTVDNTKSLTIGSGRKITMAAGSTTTINGTITGDGTLELVDTAGANLSTTGILSSVVRFNTATANITVPARTYGGQTEFYNNTGTNYTATLGTAGGQTLSFSSNFYLIAAAGGNMIVTADTNDPILNVDGNVTISANATLTASNSGSFTVAGNWSNSGIFTHSLGAVTFDAGSSGKTLSGALNGSSAFYKVAFNGSGGEWTIQDAMKVSAANAADTFVIGNGTVTLGDSNGDNLEVLGKMTIANTADQTGTFQTAEVAEGSNITFDMNDNATLPSCPNCIIQVGATSGSGQGNLKIRKNTILRLNPRSAATASNTGIEVESRGYLEIQGSQDDTGTSDGTTNETTITDTGKSWAPDNVHQNKVVRMTSGLAINKIYDITASTATTLTRADNSSSDSTIVSTSGSGPTRLVCSNSTTMITANNEDIGRYIHDATGTTGYLKITDSFNDYASCTGSKDGFTVIAEPDAFSIMSNGDTIDISDVVRQNDTFEILDYASVTAESGTACSSTVGQAGEAYIYGKDGSENVIRYVDICNLGRNTNYKHGVDFVSVNGLNANEGVTIDKSRIRNGYWGVYLYNYSSNNTLTSNQVYGNSSNGIRLFFRNGNNTLTSNQVYGNSGDGIYSSDDSPNNTLTSNQVYGNSGRGIYIGWGSNNTLISNQVYGNSGNGIGLFDSFGFTLTSNQVYGNSGDGIELSATRKSTLTSNQIYGNSYGIELTNSARNPHENTLTSNQVYANLSYGIRIYNSNNNTLTSSQVYSNSYGIYLFDSIGTVSINDNYGGLGANSTADVGFNSFVQVCNLRLYNATLASSTEVTGVDKTPLGSYLISRKHDTSAGATKIWGDYTVLDQNTETPQDETTDKFNYADNLWENSFTPHAYGGTGTEDTNLDYGINGTFGGDDSAYSYRILCTATNCVTTPDSWDVYRNGTLLTVKASTGSTYTDAQNDGGSAPNIQFKIDDAGTDYAKGATYIFTAYKASGDTNTQKTVSIEQDEDTLTVGSGKTMQFDGAGGNLTTLSTVTGAYDFTNDGTVTGGNNTLTVTGTVNGTGTTTLSSGSTFIQRVNAAKNFGTTSGVTNWTFNNLKFENSTAGALTVTMVAGGTGQNIVNGTLTIGNASDSDATTLDDETNDRIIDATDVTITSKGVLSASSTASFTVSGDWSNSGTFNAGSGTVTFDGTGAQSVTAGGSNFNNLIVTNSSPSSVTFTDNCTVSGTFTDTAGGSRLIFAAGSTYIFSNINISGASNNNIVMRSSSSGTQWYFNVSQSSPSVSYVDVKDSNASGGNEINATNNCADSGNNVNWNFGPCSNFDHLTISPDSVELSKSAKQSFTAKAINSSGDEMPDITFEWSASGGSIDNSGDYTAPSTKGTYYVTVTSNCGGAVTATVKVKGAAIIPPPTGPTSIYLTITPESATVKPLKTKQFRATLYDQDGRGITVSPVKRKKGGIFYITPPRNVKFKWSVEEGGGTIDSYGLFTAEEEIGTFRNTIKVTATYTSRVTGAPTTRLTTFGFATVSVSEEDPYLHYIKPSFISRTFKQGDAAEKYQVKAFDQFGNRLEEAEKNSEIKFELLDLEAGTFEQSATKNVGYFGCGKPGCYPNVLISRITYQGQTAFASSSINIVPEGYQLTKSKTNSFLVSFVDYAIAATSTAPRRIDSWWFEPAKSHFKPSEGADCWVAAKDQFGTDFKEAEEFDEYTFFMNDPKAGVITSNGYFQTTSTPGTYKNAIGVLCKYGDQQKTLLKDVVVSDEEPYLRTIEYKSKLYLKPNTYLSFKSSQKDQFGDFLYTTYQKDYTIDSSIGEVSGGLADRAFIHAFDQEGLFEDALTIKVTDDKGNIKEIKVDVIIDSSLKEDPCNFETPFYGKSKYEYEEEQQQGFFSRLSESFLNFVSSLGSSPATTAVATAIALAIPLVQALAALSYLPQLFNWFLHLKQNLYTWLGLRKRRKRWGIVFDNITKKPLKFVRILVYSWPDKRLKETVIANNLGEFGFLAPRGHYFIKVAFTGFSQIALEGEKLGSSYLPQRSDGYYDNLYYGGEIIDISSKEKKKKVLNISTPLKPTKEPLLSQRIISGLNKFAKVVNKVRLPLLILGTLLSISTVIYRHTWIDWCVLGLYAALWIYEIYVLTTKTKTSGTILDSQTKKPLDLTLIRLISVKTGKIASTFVTGPDGQFIFSAPSGRYTISAVRADFEPHFTKPFRVKSLTRFGRMKIEMKHRK